MYPSNTVTTKPHIISREFVWGYDDDFGEWGWRPKAMPEFNVSRGMGVAHDTLEHFDTDTGLLTDEFQAFGAIIHVRAVQGWWADKHISDPAYHLSSDVSRFLCETLMRFGTLEWALPEPTDVLVLEEDEWAEELIRRLIAKARRGYEANEGSPRPQRMWFDRAAGWIRKGYVRAQQRYAECHSPEVLFTRIEQEIDRRYTHWWGEGLYEGTTLDVRADLKTLEITLIEKEPYDPYAWHDEEQQEEEALV